MVDDIRPYKNPVPADREVVPGIWNDILDNFLASFETSLRGNTGLGTFTQDQDTEMLDLMFLEEKFTDLSLDVNTTIESRVITLTSGHGLTNANSLNHVLEIGSTLNGRFTTAKILDVTGDDVTLDTPVGDIFLTESSLVLTGNPNITQDAATGVAIDGSTTPVIFTVKPTPIQIGDINRVLLAFKSPNPSDLSTFGGAPALTVGLTLRSKRSDGTFKNLYNYKDNYDVILHGFDSADFLPKQGNSVRGFAARVTFNGQDKHGVVARLDGSNFEELQIVVNELMDNTASGNIESGFLAQGSELQQ